MRLAPLLLIPGVFAGAWPALAQPPSQTILPPQDPGVLVQQEQLRQQLIQQQNQIQALDAQIRAQQAIQEVQRLRSVPPLPVPDTTPGHALPQIDTSQLAQIPDATLADSNKKVRDAANNHR